MTCLHLQASKSERMEVTRDPSPSPNISRALFNSDNFVKHKSRKRSSRPSLEDDLLRQLNKENLTPQADQEPWSRKRSMVEVKEEQFVKPRSRGLSNRSNNSNNGVAEVFQYPSPTKGSNKANNFKTIASSSRTYQIPSIQVDDDEVFDTSSVVNIPPPSSKLCLTPSTSRTPLYRCSSSSSQYLSSLVPSPNLDRGLCCSTPNRMRLETQGLDSEEKMVLGRGAFGTVVLGKWKGKKVALKVMEKEEGGRTVRRRRSLESELQAKDLEHKNVVKVYDVFAKDNK